VLEEVLKEDHRKVRILCHSRYIPIDIIKKIATQVLILEYPIIDEELIAAIPSNFVNIITDGYYPSFESLKCTEFAHHYNADAYYNNETEEEYTPIIPAGATDVELVCNFNESTVMFLGNNSIQILNIGSNIASDSFVRLENLPNLRVLTASTNIIASFSIINQLEELNCLDPKCNGPAVFYFEYLDNDIYLNFGNARIGTSIMNFNLENLRVFTGNLIEHNQYQYLPGLKKLTTSGAIETQYIPGNLEEFIFSHDKLYAIQTEREFCKYLIGMKSIKKMPLVLPCNDYPVRKDV